MQNDHELVSIFQSRAAKSLIRLEVFGSLPRDEAPELLNS